jgi:2'-5' RNA ligase
VAVLRTFVAIALPTSAQLVLRSVVAQVASHWPAGVGRWVRPESIHLTLRFLGDTDEARVPALGCGLNEVAAADRFAVALGSVGCFPGPHRPRVIWVGVDDATGRLRSLQERVEGWARDAGWEAEERPFQPHLTLARLPEGARPLSSEWRVPVPPAEMPIDALVLFASRLRPEGAQYHRLHTAPLRSP